MLDSLFKVHYSQVHNLFADKKLLKKIPQIDKIRKIKALVDDLRGKYPEIDLVIIEFQPYKLNPETTLVQHVISTLFADKKVHCISTGRKAHIAFHPLLTWAQTAKSLYGDKKLTKNEVYNTNKKHVERNIDYFSLLFNVNFYGSVSASLRNHLADCAIHVIDYIYRVYRE
jgi:hypothetical protein